MESRITRLKGDPDHIIEEAQLKLDGGKYLRLGDTRLISGDITGSTFQVTGRSESIELLERIFLREDNSND